MLWAPAFVSSDITSAEISGSWAVGPYTALMGMYWAPSNCRSPTKKFAEPATAKVGTIIWNSVFIHGGWGYNILAHRTRPTLGIVRLEIESRDGDICRLF
jgi:hypothetical protein